jgi:hypothetical protein
MSYPSRYACLCLPIFHPIKPLEEQILPTTRLASAIAPRPFQPRSPSSPSALAANNSLCGPGSLKWSQQAVASTGSNASSLGILRALGDSLK